MSELIKLELKKMIHNPLLLPGLILLLLFNGVNFWSASVPSMVARTNDQENYVKGWSALRLEQRLAEQYGETLTDANVQQMLEDFAFSEAFLARTGGVRVAYLQNNALQQAVQGYFAEPDGRYNGLSVEATFGDQTITLGYNAGWLATAEYMLRVILLLGVFLVVVLSPIFAGEYEGMDKILLCARYGRTRLVWAKIWAGLGLTLALTVLFLAVNYGVAWLCFGSESLNASILFAPDNPFSTLKENLSCKELIAWQGGLALSAMLTMAALTMAASAALPNRYLALAASTMILFLPLMISVSPQNPLYRILILAPGYQMLSDQLLDAGTIRWGGGNMLYAWCALPASGFFILAGIYGAKRRFSRHQIR